VECLHLVLLRAGETRNTSTASTSVTIEDPEVPLNKSVVLHIPM